MNNVRNKSYQTDGRQGKKEATKTLAKSIMALYEDEANPTIDKPMNKIAKNYGFLRIAGDRLVPDEITSALGCSPTSQFKRGDNIAISEEHPPIIAESGVWEIALPATDQDDLCNALQLEDQIRSLLSRMSSKKSTWKKLRSSFEIDLFVDIDLDLAHEFELSRRLIKDLASRGIRLLFTLACISADHEREHAKGTVH